MSTCAPAHSGPGGARALADKMQETFREHGIVRLINSGVADDLALFQAWMQAGMDGVNLMDYKGGANMRSALRQDLNVYDTGAPKEAWIHYHHEMQYVPTSPLALGFGCVQSTGREGQGDTFFAQNAKVTDSLLQTEVGRKLKDKGICYIRCLTDRDAYAAESKGHGATNDDGSESGGSTSAGVYNHWQTSFGTDVPELAEAAAREKQLQVEWAGSRSRYMKTKFYVDAFEYCPSLDKNTLFASVADDAMWFDTWPGVAEMPGMADYQSASEDERPLRITYGDDSPFSADELRTLMQAYDQHGVRVQWERGDFVCFCNYRWAHGRPAYSLEEGERRELAVMLGEAFTKVGQLEGKW